MMEAEPATAVACPSTDAPACVICGTTLAGPLGALFRLVGINRSARNRTSATAATPTWRKAASSS